MTAVLEKSNKFVPLVNLLIQNKIFKQNFYSNLIYPNDLALLTKASISAPV
jgi:hypothetical protein